MPWVRAALVALVAVGSLLAPALPADADAPHLVRDIDPGSAGSNPVDLVAIKGIVLFQAHGYSADCGRTLRVPLPQRATSLNSWRTSITFAHRASSPTRSSRWRRRDCSGMPRRKGDRLTGRAADRRRGVFMIDRRGSPPRGAQL